MAETLPFCRVRNPVGQDGDQGREQEVEGELEDCHPGDQAQRRLRPVDQPVGEQRAQKARDEPGAAAPEPRARAIADRAGEEVGQARNDRAPEEDGPEQGRLVDGIDRGRLQRRQHLQQRHEAGEGADLGQPIGRRKADPDRSDRALERRIDHQPPPALPISYTGRILPQAWISPQLC